MAAGVRVLRTDRDGAVLLLDRPDRSPFWVGRAWHTRRPLDWERMDEALALYRGTHDFTSFRSAECQAASPVRELRELSVARRGRLIRVRASANAFLHHMIRNIVGTLVYVGLGRRDPEWITEVLEAKHRARAAPREREGRARRHQPSSTARSK